MNLKGQLLLLLGTLFSGVAFSQVANTGMVDVYDTISKGKVSIGGFVDVYYGYDFNRPAQSDRPYAVSSGRHNEVNINLAYIDLRYINDKVRAHLVSGFGTYVNANYSLEPGSLKNLIEANVGIRLSKKKDIWVDAGVLPSPYTNESAISKDHFMYTRSFAPEFVPYYLSGVKLSVPFGKKIKAYGYLLNGWQSIQDVNNPLSMGTQIEYRPGNKWLINWDTYVGDENSKTFPLYGNRYFSDVYTIFNPNGKVSMTACIYAGVQEIRDTFGQTFNRPWWQANVQGRVKLGKQISLAARAEIFEDDYSAMIKSATGTIGFSTMSAGLCLNVNVSDAAMFRVEARQFFSDKNVYFDKKGGPVNQSLLLITSLAAWF